MMQRKPWFDPQRCALVRGFTLWELMITASLIGLISAIGLNQMWGSEYRSERVKSVAIELAGWLEAVRSASQRQPGSNPCVVTFTATTPVSAGATLASVSPKSCAIEPVFTIRGFRNGSDTYAIALNPSTPTTVTFTPRGSISATSDTDMRIQLTGTSEMRCVRLTGTVGLIRIGSGSIATSPCTSYVAF